MSRKDTFFQILNFRVLLQHLTLPLLLLNTVHRFIFFLDTELGYSI